MKPLFLRLYNCSIFMLMLVAMQLAPFCIVEAKASNIKAMAIISSQIRPYVAALNGFKHAFKKSDLEVLDLSKNPEFVKYTLNKEKFDLYIAIGPKATKLLWEINPSGIKLTLMVLDPEAIIQQKSACGIKLRIPVEEQLAILKEKISPIKGVGILYTPGENSLLISQAYKAAQDLSISLKAYSVNSAPDIKKTLSKLYQECDTLLFIPDPTVISEPMINFLIKDALLHGVASVGYNRFFYEAGAVMAFVVDYEKLGVVAAEMANKALKYGDCTLAPPPYEILWNEKAWEFLQKVRTRMEAGK